MNGACKELNDINITEIKGKVLSGALIDKQCALKLFESDIEELCKAADEIRNKFCGNTFDICTIINGKSGRCSENCKYCAQAGCYNTNVKEYPLLDSKTMVEQAEYNYNKGVLRFSIVTSGRKLSSAEVDKVCEIVKNIREKVGIEVCVSAGLLNKEEFVKLKNAGVSRVHNNLESSENYFKSVCTTHTYDDKINAIKAAKSAGLKVCSGGIIGLGESLEDRVDLALKVRELGIKSIPVNILTPIKGTPYENNAVLSEEEVRKTLAVFRFINPDASIRLAGGRGFFENSGKRFFESGANAAISGDMLTTSGITINNDIKMLESLGYKIELCN